MSSCGKDKMKNRQHFTFFITLILTICSSEADQTENVSIYQATNYVECLLNQSVSDNSTIQALNNVWLNHTEHHNNSADATDLLTKYLQNNWSSSVDGKEIKKVFVIQIPGKNFSDALQYCKDRNGSLAKVDTAKEEKLLHCLMKKYSPNIGSTSNNAWIGLKLTTFNNTAARPCKTDSNTSMKWIDGTPIKIGPHWDGTTKEPTRCTGVKTDNDCVEIYLTSPYKWNDDVCDKKSNHFICYFNVTIDPKPVSSIQSTTPTTSPKYLTTTMTTSVNVTSKRLLTVTIDPKPVSSIQSTTPTTSSKYLTTTMTTSVNATSKRLLSVAPVGKNISSVKSTASTPSSTYLTKTLGTLVNATPTVNVSDVSTSSQSTSRTGTTRNNQITTSEPKAFTSEDTLLSYSSRTGESVIVNITMLAHNKPYHRIINTSRPSSGDLSAVSQIPLEKMLEVIPSRQLNHISVDYSIAINDRTVNKNQILNPTSYAKDAFLLTFRSVRAECVYLDEATSNFSTRGIKTIDELSLNYSCSSNHTTIFATLLTLSVVIYPLGAKVTTYVCLVISVISLLLTLFILLRVRKKLRSERTVVQINFVISLAAYHTICLFQDLATNNNRACEFVAILTHLTILSSAFWMLVEGLTLIMKTSDISMKYGSSRKLRVAQMIVGWGIPAIIVILTAMIGFSRNEYMDTGIPGSIKSKVTGSMYLQCWLSKTSGVLLWSVLVPVAISLVCNLLIIAKVGYFVYKKSKESERYRPSTERSGSESGLVAVDRTHMLAGLRAVALLVPVLGVPWILSYLAGTLLVLLYITAIANGLQGLFVFLIYCVFSTKVRKAAMSTRTSRISLDATLPRPHKSNVKPTTSNNQTGDVKMVKLSNGLSETKSK